MKVLGLIGILVAVLAVVLFSLGRPGVAAAAGEDGRHRPAHRARRLPHGHAVPHRAAAAGAVAQPLAALGVVAQRRSQRAGVGWGRWSAPSTWGSCKPCWWVACCTLRPWRSSPGGSGSAPSTPPLRPCWQAVRNSTTNSCCDFAGGAEIRPVPVYSDCRRKLPVATITQQPAVSRFEGLETGSAHPGVSFDAHLAPAGRPRNRAQAPEPHLLPGQRGGARSGAGGRRDGAAHRARLGLPLLSGPARSASPWASPPHEMLLQAVGAAEDPRFGRTPDAFPLGSYGV